MNKLSSNHNIHHKNVVRNNYRIFGWTLAWLITQVIPKQSIFLDWYSSFTLTAIVISIYLIVSIGFYFTLVRYMRELDEMARLVYLNALAFAVVIAFLGGNMYLLLEAGGLVPEPRIGMMFDLMGLTVLAGAIIGFFRYR